MGESYRDAGEIRWLLYWPDAPYWPDASTAGGLLVDACLARLERWGVSSQLADGTVPGPGEDLARPAEPPIPGLAIRRTLGINGTRLSARLAPDDQEIGCVEVDTNLEDAGRIARPGRLGDIGNLEVVEAYRR